MSDLGKSFEEEGEDLNAAFDSETEPIPVAQETPPPPPEPKDVSPGLVEGGFRSFVGGALKEGGDEALGMLAEKGLFPGVGKLKADPSGSKALRMPDGTTRTLKTDDDVYRAVRDWERMSDASFAKKHPYVDFGMRALGGVAGDVAAAGGKAIRPTYQALAGAVTGLMDSDADLTDDKRTGEAMLSSVGSAGVGGGLSYLGGKAAEKGGASLAKLAEDSRVGKWLASKSRKAAADAAETTAMKAQAALREATGAVGGATSTANRTLSVLKEVLESPVATEEQKAAARAFLEGEQGRALLQGVYENTLSRAPTELGRIATAREAMATAAQAAAPEAVDAATREALSKPGAPIKRFLVNYGSRLIPVAVGARIGKEFDSPVIGAGVGGVVGAVMGNPGTALKNLTNNPAVRKAVWDTARTVLTKTPEKLGKYGPILASMLARRGEADAEAAHTVLLEKDPDYAKAVLDFAAEPEASAPAGVQRVPFTEKEL